ncbi:MAG: hypothetical protein GKS00_19285 [Alphaproteobacteria bacterium]|nr:hypothetical protein [Alphaproteobacteria bacterium]
MRKPKVWVVVADGARGRFFQLSEGHELVSVYAHELVGEALASRDLASDRPGRTFERGGDGRHAMEPHSDPKRYAKTVLAREIGRLLEAERKKRSFDHLVVVAPPQFLGDLRGAMSKPLQELIATEINKDLSKLAPHQLKIQLGDVLFIRPPL